MRVPAHFEKGEKLLTLVCEVCGVKFTAKKSNARTCSSSCRVRLHREKAWIQAEVAAVKDVTSKATVPDKRKPAPVTNEEATAEAIEALRRLRELDRKWPTRLNLHEDLATYPTVGEEYEMVLEKCDSCGAPPNSMCPCITPTVSR